MTKIQVNEVKIGQLVKVASHRNSTGTFSLIAAHTKKAHLARVIGIEKAGRYTFIDTDMGSIMIGTAGKVTVV